MTTSSPVLGVIPARWQSTRFPGKALAPLAGRPMVEHVFRRAAASRLLQRVVVATDDQRIQDAVQAFGGEVIMTSTAHRSGSDRVAEVARLVNCQVVVNIQGDEPLLEPAAVDAAVQPLLEQPSLQVTTLAAPIVSRDEMDNPNVVKVVLGIDGRALYFSRLPLPFDRGQGGPALQQARHHIGLFAYRRGFLLQFTSWQPTPLERLESLEQLRILEHGQRLQVVEVPRSTPGVDTPEDLERVAELLAARS